MSGREKKETGGGRKTAAEKAEEMTSAFSKDQQQLLQPHPFPHKSRRRMMIQQLSLQQPLLLPHPLLPPQHRRQMIQRMQEQLFPPPNREVPHPPQPQLLPHPQPLLLHPQLLPHPESHPQSLQPQFVAAKSLIDKSSRILFTLHHMGRRCPWLQKS